MLLASSEKSGGNGKPRKPLSRLKKFCHPNRLSFDLTSYNKTLAMQICTFLGILAFVLLTKPASHVDDVIKNQQSIKVF